MTIPRPHQARFFRSSIARRGSFKDVALGGIMVDPMPADKEKQARIGINTRVKRGYARRDGPLARKPASRLRECSNFSRKIV
jgi:hypothetical protein